MRTRAVFFDLGGTLLVMRRDRIFMKVLGEAGMDAKLPLVHAAYVKVESWWLATYGSKNLTPEQTTEAYSDLDAKVFGHLFPQESVEKATSVAKLSRERWPELEKEVPPELYPDSVPLLKKLVADRYVLTLVSNAPPDAGKVVDALGLGRYFNHVVISGVVGYSKPNPEIFRIALNMSGVAPGETIHIGDLYEADVVGARGAGIEGVLLDREGTQAGLDCPRIESLDQVYEYIRR